MKNFPPIKFLLNIWKVIECMIRVWDYGKFKKSLQFTYKLMKNNSAELQFKMKNAESPLVFQLQITGDIIVFIPRESELVQKDNAAQEIPGKIKRQLNALMYAPIILTALITEVAGIIFLLLKYKNELAGIIASVFK